jgi:hypothetical protein
MAKMRMLAAKYGSGASAQSGERKAAGSATEKDTMVLGGRY